MKSKLLTSMLVAILCASCTNNNEPTQKLEPAKPILLRAALEKRVYQDNTFAFDLFNKVVADSKEENILISPLSVSIALGMTLNGATDETKNGIAKALYLKDLSTAEINEYYKIMQTNIQKIDPLTQVNIANSIWYKLGYPVKNDFLKINSENFDAEVRELDFQKSWAVDTINNWCARKTNQNITNILDEIPGTAVMYLINAVYFKGSWVKSFNEKNTAERSFTTSNNKVVKVNMMLQKDTFNYYSDDNAQYIDLPYGNNAFSMTIVLPKYGLTTENFIKSLSPEKWKSNLEALQKTEVELYFPRFKSKNKFLLNDVLKSMGMERAFQDVNEFKNITDNSVYISRVLHDTSIEVTEKGTEASAVTVVELREKAMLYPIVNVNRPFIYIIREQSTGVILFIGKMANVEKY